MRLMSGRNVALTLARTIAAAAALAAAIAGALWGTHVAGGPDSYCYLSQAEMFASATVRHTEPLAAIAPWEHGANAFVPVGHVPAAGHIDASVPMCSPGYPMVMALARLIGGRPGMFAVVPLCGAVTVWLTFVLGCRLGGPAAGAAAAVLMAASPPFLYQVVQPMSDVPAAASWAAALVAVTRPRFTSSLTAGVLGGMATGAALLVRPNLVPLAALVAFVVFIARPVQWSAVFRTWIVFGTGVLPFVVTIGLLQNAMYGGPLKSGYGNLGFLFRLDHVWPNLQRYPVWLVQTETPIVLLALLAPWLTRDPAVRRLTLWLMAFVAGVFVCYIPYRSIRCMVVPAVPAARLPTAPGPDCRGDRVAPCATGVDSARGRLRGGSDRWRTPRPSQHPASCVRSVGIRAPVSIGGRIHLVSPASERLRHHRAGKRKRAVLLEPADLGMEGVPRRRARQRGCVRACAGLSAVLADRNR